MTVLQPFLLLAYGLGEMMLLLTEPSPPHFSCFFSASFLRCCVAVLRPLGKDTPSSTPVAGGGTGSSGAAAGGRGGSSAGSVQHKG